ncbi:MAG: hypothetical protein K1W10_07870, partial [Lachnospiraceae bacterium]
NSKNSSPKFTGERPIFHYTFLFDAYKISNGLRPEEMLNLIFSGKIEDFEEIETNTFPVAARVDFIEPILGDELLNIVSEWILPNLAA